MYVAGEYDPIWCVLVDLWPFCRKCSSFRQAFWKVHCLLQVPVLEKLSEASDLGQHDMQLQSVQAEILVVELADVGPGFSWAEPCSRGCMQLLMKYGLRQVFELRLRDAPRAKDRSHMEPHGATARVIGLTEMVAW